MKRAATVQILNVNHPGKATSGDAAKYEAMKTALLELPPPGQPGLTVAEVQAGVPPLLPDDLFPGGATAGWWVKAVQLDLEARGVIARDKVTPLHLYKV